MPTSTRVVHICMTCHRVGEEPPPCHPSQSRTCDIGEPGDARSRPLFDSHGNLLTRAPKWWVDACFKAKLENQKAKH